MPSFPWKEFLTDWSIKALQDADFIEDFMIGERLFYALPEDFGTRAQLDVPRNWLGYPAAAEEQIREAEQRLNVHFPPSYRQFLAVSNGWRGLTDGVDHLFTTEEVDWLNQREATRIDIMMQGYEDPCTDERYLTYDEKNEAVFDCYRSSYLQTALQISTRKWGMGDIWLLNPLVVTSEGEWEAWHDTGHEYGPFRYKSFWDMVQNECNRYRRSIDAQ